MQEGYSNQRFPFIDGYRGILILYVMLHHFILFVQADLQEPGLINYISNFGYLAVRAFFVVSGFLIFHQMLIRKKTDSKPVLNFYIRRFFRIIPLWWLVVLVYAWISDMSFKILVYNLTFLFGFYSYQFYMVALPQSWSLFVEECFYLIFPLSFRLLSRPLFGFIVFILTYGVAFLWRNYAKEFGVPTSK